MALPEQYRDTGFVLHPALLDAALHTVALAAPDTERAVLPFSFRAVTATGVANPDTLRVRLVRQADDTYGVQLADASGAPLAAIPALVLRPVDPAQLAAAGPRPADLYRMDWAELPLSGQPAEPYAVIGTDVPQVPGGHGAPYPDLSALAAAFDAGAEVPATVLVGCPPAEGEPAEATRRAVHHALELAQEWLRDERFSASRLVLCTRDAVADRAGAAVPGLAQSAVWGLIRTAKAENPGRFALLDHDGTAQSAAALPAALATGEPETALRAGAARVPRLVRARTAHPFKGLGADGTVLITGAGGMLGGSSPVTWWRPMAYAACCWPAVAGGPRKGWPNWRRSCANWARRSTSPPAISPTGTTPPGCWRRYPPNVRSPRSSTPRASSTTG